MTDTSPTNSEALAALYAALASEPNSQRRAELMQTIAQLVARPSRPQSRATVSAENRGSGRD